MEKFTPGPWRVGIGPNERDCLPKKGERELELCCIPHSTYDALDVFAPGRGPDEWAVLKGEPDWDEHLANARLIAAAPELYDALESAPEPCKFEQDREGLLTFIRAYKEWVPKVYAALAKARGEPS